MSTKKQIANLFLTIKKCFMKLKYKKTLNVHEPKLEEKDFKNIFDAMKSNILSIEGPNNKKLVVELKKKIGSENITLTNTGTSALDICFKVLNFDKSSEILVPSFTFVASVNSIVFNSCIPHFIEIDEKTLAIDSEKLSDYLKKILKYEQGVYKNKNTGNTVKAILVVHPYGYPCDILKVKKIAKEYNLKIIEDSAECFGSYVNHKHLGTYGDVGILSFNGNKIVTSAQGGAIISSNLKYDERVKKYVNLFKQYKRQRDIFNSPSYNYKLSNFNSALVLAQVQRLDKIISDKKKLNFYYYNYFKNSTDDYEVFKTSVNNAKPNYWINLLKLSSKFKGHDENIVSEFKKKNIFLKTGWSPISKQKYYKKFPSMNLDVTNSISQRLICLPSSHFLIF